MGLCDEFSLMLQVIPRQLCDNAGFDATDVLNKLRQKHAAQKHVSQTGWPLSVIAFTFLTLVN
jgi:chaperonin GroEL (HSP60 family)